MKSQTIKGNLKKYCSLIAVAALGAATAYPCTSAIVSASKTPYGRPVLWKHRDTSATDNKVEYCPADSTGFAFTALFNASDKNLEEAWIGMNEMGFAVMNTASYNIKDDNVPEKMMDKEGILMKRALRSCITVEDFRSFLESYPKPMGVEANFGVIDAYGNGAFFETNNNSYKVFYLSDEPDGVLIRTNYSHSGRKGEGYGHMRERNAEKLLEPYISSNEVTPEVLTEFVSRTFYHDGKGKDYTNSECKHLSDIDFIPRYKSTATVAVEGCMPLSVAGDTLNAESKSILQKRAREYVMWTGLGYPPVSEIKAARCFEGGVPVELRGLQPNGHSQDGDEAKAMRDKVFHNTRKKIPTIDLSGLYNSEGSGMAQKAIERNKQTYNLVRQTIAGTSNPGSNEK